MQTALLDGSPCGYGGHCYNAECQTGSWQSVAGSWYRENLQISIPVTVVVGLIVLAILFAIIRCMLRSCSRRRSPQPLPPQRASMRQSVYAPTSGPFSSQEPLAPTRHSGHFPPPPQHPSQWQRPPSNHYGISQPPPSSPPQRYSGQSTWVDPSSYNGPHYGVNEAYGR
ncbi:hypothetical protein BD324DRAFT_61801 [Kockovaella imperatae]|uniref:Uncharacterized protein n=1 Tax=Kockovaella imperatae TaxID=4999 RepID=A0A1Y1UC09_9TREE|nr:hypothetical protein BD324DRAFT_61801 [Kockovaella imperatae]ORX35581.1 hypothetical protein BD324DRAFT_61801 [Kockovaella imperatae]